MSHKQSIEYSRRAILGTAAVAAVTAPATLTEVSAKSPATEKNTPGKAFIDGTEFGFTSLGKDDFVNVNCKDNTWTWQDDTVHCTGKPVGVIRSTKPYTNFELICQWRHLRKAGNSGIFIWSPKKSLDRLKKPGLPHGIEAQVLDPGFKEKYERKRKRKADWFTCHGDVFPVGRKIHMKPFPPVAPNGRRSFPSKNLTNNTGMWNHYYIRAINGEVRLWVNGEEVSGGTDCKPSTGYICLESEGSPIDFKGLRIRELP